MRKTLKRARARLRTATNGRFGNRTPMRGGQQQSQRMARPQG